MPTLNSSYRVRSSSETMARRCLHGALVVIAALMSVWVPAAVAQQASPQHADGVTIRGTVLNSADKFVGDASVRLEQKGVQGVVETKTDAAGVYAFRALQAGSYTLSAEKTGLRSRAITVIASSPGDQKQVDLVLEVSGVVQKDSTASSPPSTQAMEFADKPNFTVAGVTDWTAVGGHGSDSSLRTSEALARETLTLKPENPGHSASGFPGGASEENESESTSARSSCRRSREF